MGRWDTVSAVMILSLYCHQVAYSKRELMGSSMTSAKSVASLLSSIGPAMQAPRQTWVEKELNSAPRFLPFSFFNKREEVTSRVISALLDPEGLHGQGTACLNKLIELGQ